MSDSQHKQDSQSVIQGFPVGAIQFCDRGERESQRYALQEIGVGARGEEEGIRIVVGGGGLVVPVAYVFFFLDAHVDDAVGEVDEVGGEGEGPCAGNCFTASAGGSWANANGTRRTQHLGYWNPNAECRAHDGDMGWLLLGMRYRAVAV